MNSKTNLTEPAEDGVIKRSISKDIRTKRLMGHLVCTLTKFKEELRSNEELLLKRSEMIERVSLKRKAVETAMPNSKSGRRSTEGNNSSDKENMAINLELKRLEEEWENHHKLLSNFQITNLPYPFINIYYKPRKVL